MIKTNDNYALRQQPRYINPFQGRAKRIHLSGLFLFDPDVALRINGRSIRKAFTDAGHESLFKGLERGIKFGRYSKGLIEKLSQIMPPFLRDTLTSALNGCTVSAEKFSMMGPWQVYALGSGTPNGETSTPPSSIQFLSEVEMASYRAFTLSKQGKFSDASDALANDQLMKNFMSSALLRGVAEAVKFEDLLCVRAIVALEVWLSMLAVTDTVACSEDMPGYNSYALLLMPESVFPRKNTTAYLFDWLLKASDVPSATELAKDSRLRSINIDSGTLGAWSRGTNFPRSSYSKIVASALLSSENIVAFEKIREFARHLNFIGYLAQHIQAKIDKIRSVQVAHSFPEWFNFPVGFDNTESWMRGRYLFWLEFHANRMNRPY